MRLNCRNGCRLWAVCAALMLIAGCATQENHLSAPEVLGQSFNDLFEKLPPRIISDSKETFLRTDNLTALLLAGGASIAMHNTSADDEIAEHFDRHEYFRKWPDEALYHVGSPGTHFAAAGLWYMVSMGQQDELNQERAWTMISALSINGLATLGLKAIRDNETPIGKNWAWPSGHTSSSFCIASVLDEFYGPEVGIPSYVLASLVGWRMMDAGDHWASDVVFGATLGWIVGHTVAGNLDLEIAGFDVVPYMGGRNESVMGITLVKQF